MSKHLTQPVILLQPLQHYLLIAEKIWFLCVDDGLRCVLVCVQPQPTSRSTYVLHRLFLQSIFKRFE